MTSRSLSIYAAVAALLAGLTALHLFTHRKIEPVAQRIVPGLEPAAVRTVTVFLPDQPELRLERTNGGWRLEKPLEYPAQAHMVEALLARLEKLTPAATVESAELKNRPKAEEEFGFKTPQASLVLEQPDYRAQVVIGARTAPGDQCFVKLLGQGAIHVVDASLLQLLPKTANDLRDTALVSLRGLEYDRLSVSNGPLVFELERHPDTKLWRMVRPISARADSDRVNSMLQRLETVRVNRFVTDDPKADLEPFGLQPPSLEILLKNGTNTVSSLRVGRSPTNEPQQLFARAGQSQAIVTIPREELAAWRGAVNDFRSRHLVGQVDPVSGLRVQGEASFSIVQTNGAFRVLPFNWPADAASLTDCLSALANMHVIDFVKDVVTPADLPNYGLAVPSLKYVLYASAGTNASATNRVLLEVDFGTNIHDRVYARRSDESSVYAVGVNEFSRLPRFPVQLRDRKIWEFNEDDVVSVTIKHKGRTRQLLRRAAHEWSLAPGSQGVINELAIEESVKPLCRLKAAAWISVGEKNREVCGFTEDGHQLVLELKNGAKHLIEFGGVLGADSALAGVRQDGDFWIFELPPGTYRFVATYLDAPAGLN